MQTNGKIFLRIHKTATMGDVRAKIMEVLDLPRSAFGSPRGWGQRPTQVVETFVTGSYLGDIWGMMDDEHC